MKPKKAHDDSLYVTVSNEKEFHEAMNRGYDVELDHALADQIGVPMNEDVGTVAEIDQARNDPYD